MKLVYTSENRFLVGNARNILAAKGIDVTLRNEHAASALGELPAFEAWPELWVVNDEDYDTACEALRHALSEKGTPPWRCSNCGEENDVAFDFCWCCSTDRPGT
ncbi:DUF2007 domain-containing protein [Pseudohalioglobus sediminis]|uniref:DUF2007 domain-containing protein n=1 Tax=Pseudohalioglobus sediminis TaxID=2606449 RepID=A0A5B0WSV0_9GAMM|nr:DUF2007 domain-containing protein [Pseudohalioglobus sediminis]KAA1189986.1 DUF2007 domain-containing protein [Pseudohalioglobus sediminis]